MRDQLFDIKNIIWLKLWFVWYFFRRIFMHMYNTKGEIMKNFVSETKCLMEKF